jgi:hypothetical protein
MGIFSFWDWGRDWPWIIIIIGLCGVFKYIFRPKSKHAAVKVHIEDPEKDVKQAVKDVLGKVEKGEMSAEQAAEKIKEDK